MAMYQILESSSSFWPPLTSINDGLLSPQNTNISSYQNLDTITVTNSLIHQNGVVDVPQNQTHFIQQVSENLNSNSGGAVSNKRSRPKQKTREKEKEKEKWYKGHWTISEDRKLSLLVLHHGVRKWSMIAQFMDGRIGKQCRERWHNNLRPPISKNIVWSDEEEMLIIEGHERFGNRWSRIARYIPGRSENDIKNHWNKTYRRQCSSKNIKRPKRLRRLYQSKVLENYIRNKFFSSASTSAAAASSSFHTTYIQPPFPSVSENNALIPQYFSTINPTATFFPPPPTTTFNQNYNDLISTFSTFAPPPFTPNITSATTFIEKNALIAQMCTTPGATFFTPPPSTENNALIATDLPLSVDDYETDGIPYFAFESSVDENGADLVHNVYHDDSGNAEGLVIGDADYGAATSYFAAETVDEEMDFMRSLFGNNGDMY